MTQSEPKPRRPFLITLFSLVFLGLSLAGWARLVLTIANASLLVELGARPGPAYLGVLGALEGVLGLPVALGLWTGRGWAPRAAVFAGAAYVFITWLDRFLGAQTGAAPQNSGFIMLVSLLGMGLLFWAVTAPRSRAYFNAKKAAFRGSRQRR